MPDTPIEALYHLIQKTNNTQKQSIQTRSHDGVLLSDALANFSQKRLIPLWNQERNSLKSPYVLSLVGLSNVGKSTLTEALLGFPVAPRKSGPATAIPVEYIYSDNWAIEILYRNFHTDNLPFGNAESLGKELMKRVVTVDLKAASIVAWVTVKGPMEMLKSGLTLADTPGFGAALIGHDDGAQSKRLEAFILNRVHRLFFCVAAGEEWTISDIEKDFYEKHSHICSHVIVNKWNGTADEEEKYKQKYSSIFPLAKFIFVDARLALVKKSNFKAFHEIIDAYSTPDKRREMCLTELIRAWNDINRCIEKEYSIKHIEWSKLALQNFIHSCSPYPCLNIITKMLRSEV